MIVERIQVIAEKEMTSKLLKQFSIRTFTYSLLYFAMIVLLFIFQPLIPNSTWLVLLIMAVNVLFLMLLSKLATTDAFDGINTTAAPRQSLNRISTAAAVPMFIFTCIFSFIDIIFLHSVVDLSLGYTTNIIVTFAVILVINLIIWSLVVNIYEKRILKKYLTLEETVGEEK